MGRDPGVYAEDALREDAREAAQEAAMAGPELTAADEPVRFDTAAVNAALGGHGHPLPGGVFAVRMRGAATTHQLTFHPASGGRAALTGDVVVPGRLVSAAVRELARHGITVTRVRAAEHDVAGGATRAVLQVWAVDDAVAIARGLHESLERTVLRAASGS